VLTTFQQLPADFLVERFADYVATKRRFGARHLGSRDRVG